MTYSRLYDYNTWHTRTFVRDTLKAVFPDRADDIEEAGDPGEYGLEDYYCRSVCCFIFSMAVMNDLYLTLSLCLLFYHVPSNDASWIWYNTPAWEDKYRAKQIHGWNELDLVKFGVAGMPLHWKLINIVAVLVPKFLLWGLLVNAGFHFLMETSGIVDLIMNSLAMTFILGIDELIFAVMTSVPVKHMMEKLQEYELFSVEHHETEPEEDTLERYTSNEFGHSGRWRFFKMLIPRRMLCVIAVTAIFTFRYYHNNCVTDEHGGTVSKPMYLPKGSNFNPFEFIFSSMEDLKSKTFWSMPEVGADDN